MKPPHNGDYGHGRHLGSFSNPLDDRKQVARNLKDPEDSSFTGFYKSPVSNPRDKSLELALDTNDSLFQKMYLKMPLSFINGFLEDRNYDAYFTEVKVRFGNMLEYQYYPELSQDLEASKRRVLRNTIVEALDEYAKQELHKAK